MSPTMTNSVIQDYPKHRLDIIGLPFVNLRLEWVLGGVEIMTHQQRKQRETLVHPVHNEQKTAPSSTGQVYSQSNWLAVGILAAILLIGLFVVWFFGFNAWDSTSDAQALVAVHAANFPSLS